MCRHLQSHKGIIQALHLLVSSSVLQVACQDAQGLLSTSLRREHLQEVSQGWCWFQCTLGVKGIWQGELDQSHQVTMAKLTFFVCFLFGRFLTLLPVFNVWHEQPIKLFYYFPPVIKVWRLHLNQPRLYGSHKFLLVPGNKITLLAIRSSDSFLLCPFKVHTLQKVEIAIFYYTGILLKCY